MLGIDSRITEKGGSENSCRNSRPSEWRNSGRVAVGIAGCRNGEVHGDISGWNQYIAVTNRSTGIHFTSDWRGKLIWFHCFSCKTMGLYCTSDWRGKPIRFHCFSYKRICLYFISDWEGKPILFHCFSYYIVGLVHFGGSSGMKRTNICVPMLSLPLFDNDCESIMYYHVIVPRVALTGWSGAHWRVWQISPTETPSSYRYKLKINGGTTVVCERTVRCSVPYPNLALDVQSLTLPSPYDVQSLTLPWSFSDLQIEARTQLNTPNKRIL